MLLPSKSSLMPHWRRAQIITIPLIWLFWVELKNDQALKGYQVLHFQPFDPVHKRTEAIVKGHGWKGVQSDKGAPQVILELSANAGQVKPAVEKAVNEFAARGFRSLGVARADGDGQWQYLGVLPLFDPHEKMPRQLSRLQAKWV